MNILFVTESEISPMMGGTEHITQTLGASFMQQGHGCFLAFGKRCNLPLVTEFTASLPYDEVPDTREAFARFLEEQAIDIVVSNLVQIAYKRRLLPMLYSLTRERGIGMVVCLHAMPGEEILGNSFRSSLWRLCHGYPFAAGLKDLALGLVPTSVIRKLFRKKLMARYRLLYNNADAVVLLSTAFYPAFCELGGLTVDSKFKAIPSALSYHHFADEAEICAKEKEVLIIARMDERSKRLSAALKIWRCLERAGRCPEWHLTLVGGGTDLEWYRRMARRMHLQRVTFAGRVEDLTPYYRRSSIFMMTSAYEGWGLTLTESQQWGVVPMAFYSYASLPDIITDGESGLIIKNRDIVAYAESLAALMEDGPRRERMAAAAVEASRRYEPGTIAARWLSLFESVIKQVR